MLTGQIKCLCFGFAYFYQIDTRIHMYRATTWEFALCLFNGVQSQCVGISRRAININTKQSTLNTH